MAIVGYTTSDMLEALTAFEHGESHPRLQMGLAAENRKPGIVFVYSGVGGHWPGMGSQLLAQDPIFSHVIEQCDAAFRPYVNWSLIEQLKAGKENSRFDEIDVVQPCSFAIQAALTASLQARGIIPDVVIGHSMGEVVAAYVSGALSLEDASAVICNRSRLMRRVSGKGAMAAIGLTREKADALLSNYRTRLSIAVSNSPSSTVLSGDPEALEEVLIGLRAQNIFTRAVNVDVAAHSPQMDPLRPELVSTLSNIHPKATTIPLYSTVLAGPVDGSSLNADYWGKNLRQPVLFSSTIEQVIAEGYDIFIECGPHPLLLPAISQAVRPENSQNNPLTLLPTMRRAENEQTILQSVAAGLYTAGVSVDWKKILPEPGDFVHLPAYPWQRKRYWIQVKQNAFDPLANWVYQIEWKPQDNNSVPIPQSLGTWLVFCETSDPSTRVCSWQTGSALSAGILFVSTRETDTTKNHLIVFAWTHTSLSISKSCWGSVWQFSGLAGSCLFVGPAGTQSRPNRSATLRSPICFTEGGAPSGSVPGGNQWQPGGNPRLWLITRQAQPVAGDRPLAWRSPPCGAWGEWSPLNIPIYGAA